MENEAHNYKTEIEKNGAIAIVPKGNSMWPILKYSKQSVIIIKKEKRLNKYDIAFYTRENGTFILHRVMEVLEDGYVIQGDSQNSLEHVKEEKVFGVFNGYYKGKKFISADNPKYLKKVKNWYKRKLLRKVRLKFFYFRVRVKGYLNRKLKKHSEENLDTQF